MRQPSSYVAIYLKYDHVTQLIRDRLHWLPVPQGIEFKLCLLTFKSLRGVALRLIPRWYLLFNMVESGLRSTIDSTTNGDLRVRRMCTKFGDRSFSLVRVLGTSYQWTFVLATLSTPLNGNLNNIYFVLHMDFNCRPLSFILSALVMALCHVTAL